MFPGNLKGPVHVQSCLYAQEIPERKPVLHLWLAFRPIQAGYADVNHLAECCRHAPTYTELLCKDWEIYWIQAFREILAQSLAYQ